MAEETKDTSTQAVSATTTNKNSVLDKIEPAAGEEYYSDEFRQMFEDHISHILNFRGTSLSAMLYSVRAIKPDEHQRLLRYSGDWFGFLGSLSIPKKYHWPIIRLNGLWDPFGLTTDLTSFLMPYTPYVDQLARLCKEKRT